MLARHGLALDAVIELRVDEDALLRRIESRIAEMKARGEPLRADDNPEVLHRRLAAYREQTAPLIAYYRRQGMLRSVDGMAPIGDGRRRDRGRCWPRQRKARLGPAVARRRPKIAAGRLPNKPARPKIAVQGQGSPR